MPETPVMTLRVDDEMKARWQAHADELGLDLSDWLRQAANAFLRRKTRTFVHVPPASENLGVAETRKALKARRR